MNNWRNNGGRCFHKVHEGSLNRPESPDLNLTEEPETEILD